MSAAIDYVTSASPSTDWDALAAFLRGGFDRPFVAGALAEEFRDGFVTVLRDGDRLVGSQGFMPIRLDLDGREVVAAKSERTLLDPSARGGGNFARMYDAAVSRARDELGAQVLIGLTAIPDVFEKVGYITLSRVYWHSLVPIRVAPARSIVAHRLGAVGRRSRSHADLRPAVGLWWDDNALNELGRLSEYDVVVPDVDGATIAATVDPTGRARLRHLRAGTMADAARAVAALVRALHERGDVTVLRLSWNVASPTGALLARALRAAPYPYRRGGGHFIVRSLSIGDMRLLSHAESWDLFGWEDCIHEPGSAE